VRIVCDTNVLISGILYGGPPREVLGQIIERKHDAYISPAIENELRAVLARRKFGLTAPQVQQIAQHVHELFQTVQPDQALDVIDDDPADNAILECAAAGADVIVSGDRHLLDLARLGEIRIVSPADFLNC